MLEQYKTAHTQSEGLLIAFPKFLLVDSGSRALTDSTQTSRKP